LLQAFLPLLTILIVAGVMQMPPRCRPGQPILCNDGNACTTDYCDEQMQGCASVSTPDQETAGGPDGLCRTTDDNLALFGPEGACGTTEPCLRWALPTTYLVTAVTCAGESSPGYSSAGVERTIPAACP
jgi:hypothetical protein